MADEQIKQTTPDLRGELTVRLGKVPRSLQKWHAARHRLSGNPATDNLLGQGRVLALLNARGQMRQRDMNAALGVRPQSLGELLIKLERAGYVTREPDPTDKRILLVRITDAGRTCVDAHELQMPFASFTDEELEQFIGLLDRALGEIDRQSAQMAKLSPEKPARA